MFVIAALCVMGALVALFFALGILGDKESEAATRLREITSPIEHVKDATTLREKEKESFARRFTPKSFIDRAERNYMLAGRPEGWNVAKILSMKVILAAVGLALGLMYKSSDDGILGLVILLGAPLVGYFAPDILISGKAKRRQEEIQEGLPDLLDQMVISIESGSSFENALTRSGQKGEGPLAEEIVRTVQDLALGVSRRDAYDALVERTDVDDLRKFVRSVVQGEEFGVPVSDIVRDQAAEMRVTRRMRAEGKANQVPVKMLFPLMGTILPVLFLIVISPAVLAAMEGFKGM